jgi:hypothetical protein
VIGRRVLLLVLAASLAAASTARAGTTDREQIIITDAASDVMIASLFSTGVTERLHAAPFYLGLAGAFLGGPIVHAAHDDWDRAGISFGARIAMPMLGGFIGGELCSEEERHEMLGCLGNVFVGAAVGMLGAQVLDATVIARGSTAGQMPAVRMLSFGIRF